MVKLTEKYSKQDIEDAISKSSSILGCLKILNFKTTSGSAPYKQFRQLCAAYGVEIIFVNPIVYGAKTKRYDLDDFITNKKSINTHSLKLKLYKAKVKEPKCEICGIEDWLGKSISFHLDHINGNNQDNSLDNLQILCPNCHSQTDTYAGKKNKKFKPKKDKLIRVYSSKIEWPSKEELQSMVDSMPVREVAKKLKVSDVSVHKKCASMGIEKKPQGFWLKNQRH